MNKIIVSLGIIGAVLAVGAGATNAWLTDTSSAVGNTFSVGTLEMAVNWSKSIPFHFEDMKPSQVAYSNFEIKNVGADPINITKEVENVVTIDPTTNRPECIAEDGTYTEGEGCTGNEQIKDVDAVVQYDLSVKVYDPQGVQIWNQTLHDMDKTISQIMNDGMFLGMIPSGWTMKVVESYHMSKDAGNEYQGDTMTFDIVVTGEQLEGIAVLENKDQNRPVNDGWFVLADDAYKGTLTYGVKDATFNYNFAGVAPLANTNYSLVMYEEPSSTPSSPAVWPRPVIILGAGTTDGAGAITLTGTPDTGDMLNAKIWLVKTADLVGNTLSGFNPASYLFDTGLIDYYKS
jgi:predicted ribosomally synthesized peptide with SipW-like signal peptide